MGSIGETRGAALRYGCRVANEVVCGSRIEGVTVYARGAVVRRRVALPEALPVDPCDVVVGGVTAFADAGTMRATTTGGREVLGVRARLVVPERPAVDGSLAGKLDALRRKRDDLATARSHAGWRRDVLASVQPDPDLVRRVLAIDPAERTADALAVVALVADEMAALDAKIAELSDALERNEREGEALRLAAAQASAAEDEASAPLRFAVVVQLGPAKEGKTASAMELEYAVAAARWWPAYRARFSDGASRAAITLSAMVAQASGEDWTQVALALSTGDLLRDARLPEITSLRLGRAQKPRARGYRAPPEGLDAMFDGYDRFVAELSVTTVTTATIAVSTRGPQTGAAWPAGHAGLPAPYAEYQAHEDEYDSPTTVTPPQDVTRAKRAAPPPKAEMQAALPKGRARIELRARLGAAEYGRSDDSPGPMPSAIPMAPMAMAKPMAGPPGGAPMQDASIAMQDARRSLARGAGGGGAPPPRSESASYESGMLATLDDGTLGGELGGEGGSALPIEPADAWLDFDSLRLDPEAARDRRGRLGREAGPAASGAAAALWAIERMEPPAGAIDPRASRGLFDVVYSAAGTADVPSSARPHRVTVLSAEAPATARFVTVPREAAEVYRRADVTNPFGQPLLTGPVEVLIDGALAALTRLSYTDRGGQISIGLGVEERVRVARNTRVEEGSAGLLGGSTTVEHTVTTELSSSLGRAIRVEIVDRLPVSDDKDVEIKQLASSPQASAYTQAELGQPVRKAFKWEVDVPAGGKAKAEWRYRVTLPSKMEIVGGNRRE